MDPRSRVLGAVTSHVNDFRGAIKVERTMRIKMSHSQYVRCGTDAEPPAMRNDDFVSGNGLVMVNPDGMYASV